MLPIDAIRSDYADTLGFINKCDDHIFKVRNWALVTSSAVIAFAISKDKDAIVLVNLALLPAFLYLELIYKSFQDSAINHTTELSERIDAHLADPAAEAVLAEYRHGFGRKLEYPSVNRVFRILLNRSRWHILNFYSLLLIVSLGALAVGALVD
jgi:hypothetical protein